MDRITLGRTELRVTRLGPGLAALGRPGYIDLGRDEDLGESRTVEEMERRAHDVLDAAYEAGIRYLDAARSFGRAEAFAAALANPWAGVVLSGAATPGQVRSNVKAVDLALQPAELEELRSCAEPAEDYWRRRAALAWS